jgi:hypothetical protein
MAGQRLTVDLVPLHFEVSGLCPIGVGEVQRARDSKPNIQKPSDCRPEAFVFLTVLYAHSVPFDLSLQPFDRSRLS